MPQGQADESLDLYGIHDTVVVSVKDVEGGSDEGLAVMETGVPGVGKGLPLDAEAGSYMQQVRTVHLRQQMSQATHCKEGEGL